MTKYTITTDWQGKEIPSGAHVRWGVSFSSDGIQVEVEAPFYANPRPSAPPGPTERLWEFEVVEIFFLGDDGRYLEVELGPFGHYLVLMLEGKRKVQMSLLPIEYRAVLHRDRWRGRALIPKAYLPEEVVAFNAYAIFEMGGVRNHSALFPLGGDVPDFHRLEDFQSPWSKEGTVHSFRF